MHRPPLALGVTCCRIMPLATGREKGYHGTGAATRARNRTCAAAPSDQNAVGGNPSTSFSEPGSSPPDKEVQTSLFAQAAQLHSAPGLLTARIHLHTGRHSTDVVNVQPPCAARARARRRSRRSCRHDSAVALQGAIMPPFLPQEHPGTFAGSKGTGLYVPLDPLFLRQILLLYLLGR